MQRRSFLLRACLLPLTLFSSGRSGSEIAKDPARRDVHKLAEDLDELASNIRTPADASRFVDFVAGIFVKELPAAWRANSFRNMIARAEFMAVTDADRQIPEQRIAAAWNVYASTIQAPKEFQVTPADIHRLRDGLFATAVLFWKRGHQNFWGVPSIYATQADGTLQPGCRAIESIRLLWDLANTTDNLQGARDRVQSGVVFSNVIQKEQQQPTSSSNVQASVQGRLSQNPIELTQRLYINQHGTSAFNKAVMKMVGDVCQAG
jgi:hypothetical protein